MKRTVIIQIKDSKIFFNESTFLELSMTNLPVQHFQISGRTMYWELYMEAYDSDISQLNAVVADYTSKKIRIVAISVSKKESGSTSVFTY